MERIFHITDAVEWRASRWEGRYVADSLDSEGFIHFSLEHQVEQVANARFAGREGLVVLEVDPARAGSPVRMENTDGGDELYPHLYGPLDVEAVVRVHELVPGEDGRFTFPAEQTPPVGATGP
jgi:uncharacterized protein (DUF952 family)